VTFGTAAFVLLSNGSRRDELSAVVARVLPIWRLHAVVTVLVSPFVLVNVTTEMASLHQGEDALRVGGALLFLRALLSHAIDKGVFAVTVYFLREVAGLWVGALLVLWIVARRGNAPDVWIEDAARRVFEASFLVGIRDCDQRNLHRVQRSWV